MKKAASCKSYYAIPVFLAGIFFLLSACENDVEVVSSVTAKEQDADEVMDTVYSVLTDDGRIKFTLKAARIEKYYQDEPKTFFPEGVEVEFYDSLFRKEAVLKANQGIIYDGQNRIELHGDVVFKNLLKDQKMFSEQLVWEQGNDSSLVYSDAPVRVEDEGNHYYGKDGIIADETFSWYEIKGFSADMAIPDSSQSKKEQK